MSEPVNPKPVNIVNRLIKIMIVGFLLAASYVVLKGCQNPKTGMMSYATGEMSKLQVIETPKAQPEIAFKNADGKDVTLGDFQGKTVIVNVWATWCGPCVHEMPSLNALATNPPADNIEVVAISVDRQADEAQDFLDSLQLDGLKLYHDPSFGIARSLDAPGLPITVIYDWRGREVARLSGGADWNSPEARSLIEAAASR